VVNRCRRARKAKDKNKTNENEMGAGDTWFREPGQLEPELHGPMMGCLCPSPGELDSFTANQHLPCMVFVGTSGDSSTEDTSEHVDESLWSPRLVWLLPSMIAGNSIALFFSVAKSIE
jgi:hypothetical protein